MKDSIVVLGGGIMGGALASRWHSSGRATVHVIERDEARRNALGAQGILTHPVLADAPSAISTLVLAIKPQQFAGMKEEIKLHAGEGILLSIMAGIPLAALSELSPYAVRVMPNLPSVIGEGMAVACAPAADEATRQVVTELFRAVGHCEWVEDEALLHVATGISGSGPGYVFAFMEALETAAVAQGLNPHQARILVAQTLRGSALLAAESPDSFTRLREQVTSPAGTTQAALEQFSEADLTGMVDKAVGAAVARSKQLVSG